MEGSHSPRLSLATASCEEYEAASPRLPRFETATTEDECETPRLDAPVSCSDLELELMKEGGMEALD
jgi:hypothetical protein